VIFFVKPKRTLLDQLSILIPHSSKFLAAVYTTFILMTST